MILISVVMSADSLNTTPVDEKTTTKTAGVMFVMTICAAYAFAKSIQNKQIKKKSGGKNLYLPSRKSNKMLRKSIVLF